MLNLQQKYITENRPKAPPPLRKQNYPLDPHLLVPRMPSKMLSMGEGAYNNKPAYGKNVHD